MTSLPVANEFERYRGGGGGGGEGGGGGLFECNYD
jgi:hypothetical protein